ncbi:hypothetical protein M9194_14755 [Vibrio sp. S4M6]|uniref:hypothetical protein n=1 Tax=Vibrio sinus TaxID=2946865 RepID=UPI00202AA2BD|nr:hypothetical protein [Vibrio sinus]MCL9782693.1 hypothetical protein [Vibrio sinus]
MLKTILVTSSLLIATSSYAMTTNVLSNSDVQNVLQQSSSHVQANLQANPDLLPEYAARINLAYEMAKSGNPSSVAAASSMVTSFISSEMYSYRLPMTGTDSTDCSAQLAASQAAAKDALNSLTSYNMSNYVPGDNLPVGSKYGARDIISGIFQGAMIAGISGISADQVSIGTYKVCNENSLKALSYMTTITNLTNTMFNTFIAK